MDKNTQATMNDMAMSDEKKIQAVTPMMDHIKLKANDEVLRSSETRDFRRTAAFVYAVLGEKWRNKEWAKMAAEFDHEVYQQQCISEIGFDYCLAGMPKIQNRR